MNDAAYEKWLSQFTIMGDQAYSANELPYEMRHKQRRQDRRKQARHEKGSQKFLADYGA